MLNKKLQKLLIFAVVGLLMVALTVGVFITTMKDNGGHGDKLDESVKIKVEDQSTWTSSTQASVGSYPYWRCLYLYGTNSGGSWALCSNIGIMDLSG